MSGWAGAAALVGPWAGWIFWAGLAGVVVAAGLPSAGTVRLSAARRPTGPRRNRGSLPPRLRRRVEAVFGTTEKRGRAAAVHVCRVFAAELRAGRPPGTALEAAVGEGAAEGGGMAAIAAAVRSGADPVPALRRASEGPGLRGLAHLAACWEVTARSGAGPADVADRLAAALAREEGHRRELTAQLAGPRTTVLLLAALPAAGIAMAGAVGGGPVGFLLGTPAGLVCLTAGLVLDALGLWWTHRMVRRASAALDGP